MKTIILQTILHFTILFSMTMILPYVFKNVKELEMQFLMKTLVILSFSIGIGIKKYLEERE